MVRAPPAQSVIEDAAQLLHREAVEDFLRAAVRHRVGEGADGTADHMDDAGVVWVIVEERWVVHMKMIRTGHGYVVVDQIGTRIVFRDDIVAEPEPEDVPAVSVRRMGLECGGLVKQISRAFGEVEELGFYADIPICVVFENEGGREVFFHDTAGGTHQHQGYGKRDEVSRSAGGRSRSDGIHVRSP